MSRILAGTMRKSTTQRNLDEEALKEKTKIKKSILEESLDFPIIEEALRFHQVEERLKDPKMKEKFRDRKIDEVLKVTRLKNVPKNLVRKVENLLREIVTAIVDNNNDLLTQLLTQNPDIEDCILDHRSILNLSIELETTDVFATLIRQGFDPRFNNFSDSPNPIAFAAFRKKTPSQLKSYCDAILEKFGKHGPKIVERLISIEDVDGHNALAFAGLKNPDSETIKFLKSRSTDSGDKDNVSPNLHDAIKQPHNQTSTNSDNKKEDGWGGNLTDVYIHTIYKTCCQGDKSDFETLIPKVTSLELEDVLKGFDASGRSPLCYAIETNRHNELVEMLLDKGSDLVNFLDSSNQNLQANLNNLYLGPDGKAVDALSFCILERKFDTFGLILRHRSFAEMEDPELLFMSRIINKMLRPQILNESIIEQFFKNIPVAKLHDLQKYSPSHFNQITAHGIDLAPETTLKKMTDCFAEVPIGLAELLAKIKQNYGNLKAVYPSLTENINKFFSEHINGNNTPKSVTISDTSDQNDDSSIRSEEMKTDTEETPLLNQQTNYGTASKENDNSSVPSGSTWSKCCEGLLHAFGLGRR